MSFFTRVCTRELDQQLFRIAIWISLTNLLVKIGLERKTEFLITHFPYYGQSPFAPH